MARPKKNKDDIEVVFIPKEYEGSKPLTSLGDLIYKPKQLTGLNIVGMNDSIKHIVNMNTLFHKILNVLIQNTHNGIYDKVEVYESENIIYRKISLSKLVKKLGVSTKTDKSTKSNYKDIRFIIDKTVEMMSMYLKLRNSKVIESFPMFNNIKYIEEEECFYYSFNDRIIKSISNNYIPLDCSNLEDKSSYIPLNISELHKIDLSLHSMMLYEFLHYEKYNVTVNDKTFKLDEVFDYISNNKEWKPSRKIENILIPAIKDIESKLGIKVYYYIKRAMTNNRIVGIKLKAFKVEDFKEYENSKSIKDVDFVKLSSLKNVDIFKLGDLDLYNNNDSNYNPYINIISLKEENLEYLI